MGGGDSRTLFEWGDLYHSGGGDLTSNPQYQTYKAKPDIYDIKKVYKSWTRDFRDKFRAKEAELNEKATHLTDAFKPAMHQLANTIDLGALKGFDATHIQPWLCNRDLQIKFDTYQEAIDALWDNINNGKHGGIGTTIPPNCFGMQSGRGQYANDERYSYWYTKYFDKLDMDAAAIIAQDLALRPPVIFNGDGNNYISDNKGSIGNVSARVRK